MLNKNIKFRNVPSYILILTLSLLEISCTTITTSEDSVDPTAQVKAEEYIDGVPLEEGEVIEDGIVSSELALQRELPQKEEVVAPEEEFKNAVADNHALPAIPIERNEHVEKWITYFQGRGREAMEKFLRRSTRYVSFMQEVLASYGLPKELVYVAMIESGFNSKAYSSASAVGYWQFMRGTGRQYGLKINSHIDERRDPVLSTHAAARYLKGLYHLFGSWHLAIPAYNVGENRMKYVVMKNYTRDFWKLVKNKKLPSETLNYLPKFMAAKIISENPRQYGFDNIAYAEPISFDSVELNKTASLSRFAHEIGASKTELRKLNPQLKGDVIWIPRGERRNFRVPKGMKNLAMNARSRAYMKHIPRVRGEGYHLVRRGDNLISIARRYKTSVSSLRRINNLRRRSIIKIGMRLKVDGKRRDKTQTRSYASNGKKTYHKVKNGENLSLIAKKYGTTVSKLQKMNNLDRKSVLHVGKKLQVSKGHSIHIVRRGDTLSGIADKYRVSMASLRKENRIKNRSVLHIGKKIRIPARVL